MAEVELLDRHYRPYWDQDEVHNIHRDWRKITNTYKHDPMLVSEAWAPTDQRTAMYVRPDELHQSFNFSFLTAKWEAKSLKQIIDKSMTEVVKVGAPPSWVWENHDVVRKPDRLDLGLQNKGKGEEKYGDPIKLNKERALKRARAATLLELALPGGAYIYQGEELALPEVRDIPEHRLEDPRWNMSNNLDKGRDGCRVPLPWRSTSNSAFGFSGTASVTPEEAWLPQPNWWGDYSVESQDKDPASTLNMYRTALEIRHKEAGLGDGAMEWVDFGPDVLAFRRAGNFLCLVNFGGEIKLPEGELLVSSSPIRNFTLSPDTAVWMRTK
ncbi:MAG: hypothetical protein RL256_57, partial [Actinomycetota bacterium]